MCGCWRVFVLVCVCACLFLYVFILLLTCRIALPILSCLFSLPPSLCHSVMLCGNMTSLLWQQEGMTFPDRRFLLQMLALYIDKSNSKMSNHFAEGDFSECMEILESKKYPKKENLAQTRLQYIETMAKKLTLCPSCDPFQHLSTSMSELGMLQCVAVCCSVL